MHGYDTTPDYDEFWLERDYRKDAAKSASPCSSSTAGRTTTSSSPKGSTCTPALPVDNPKTKAVEGVPFKKIWLTQSNSTPTKAGPAIRTSLTSSGSER